MQRKNSTKAQRRPEKKRKRQRSRPLRLVIGLGNPGREFERTRHNVGFDVVRRVASISRLKLKKQFLRPYLWSGRGTLVLSLPLTYMNRSGLVVPSLLRASGATVEDLVVVCDNMDLQPGVVRLKRKGSSRSHNGLVSIMDALGTGEFARLYIGVGRPSDSSGVVDHVLAVPDERELPRYDSAVREASEALTMLADEDLDRVMNRVNLRQ